MSFALEVLLDTLGINDPADRQTVKDGLPILKKFIDHVNENKPLFATLSADAQLLLPAAKIVVDALVAIQQRYPS